MTASLGLLFETRWKVIISKENLVLWNGPDSHLGEKKQSSKNLLCNADKREFTETVQVNVSVMGK